MEAFDLNGFAEGEELNPSAYNPEDYPTKEEMLDFIYSNSHKPPVNIAVSYTHLTLPTKLEV